MQYRLYRFTPTNTAYATVPRSKAELLQHLMKNGEYGEIRDITGELTWFETVVNMEYVAGTYRVLAELEDCNTTYMLVENPWYS
jgi:hypothetical protein